MMKQISQGIFLDESIKDDIKNIDGIIFDCDGVLVDITESYDLTIKKTTKHVLEKFIGIINPIPIDSKIIDGFKATGGFNDEVDLTYASILSIYAAQQLHKNQHDFIFHVINHANSSGISSVEKFLEKQIDLSEIMDKLQYPGSHHKNPIYKIFDQLFYGPILYYKLFKQQSEFLDNGLIENDKIIFSKNLANILKKKFGKKMGIVTGRGKESIQYSLKQLLDEFDIRNSAFLEDEPRELAKPNPGSLIRAIDAMEINHCLYVGDSMEDFMMALESTKMNHKATFCGIFGTSKEPMTKLNLFDKNNAKMALESINLLPKVLNLEQNNQNLRDKNESKKNHH